jgi:hypothetical protein
MDWREFRKLEWLVIMILGVGLGWILVSMNQPAIEALIVDLLQ